jgi:hypothetical protein
MGIHPDDRQRQNGRWIDSGDWECFGEIEDEPDVD